jgi:AcrR family transcriptional regulator
VRSREAIIAALREAVTSGEPVTISSVTGAASVTRATFYNNFSSMEEAAWSAISGDLKELLEQNVEERRSGTPHFAAGVETLQRTIDLLRHNHELTRLANSYRDKTGLPGIAAILLTILSDFRAQFGDPDAPNAEAENVYVAAGLHGLFQVAVENGEDSASIARAAHALMPAWMQNPT